MKQTYDLLKDDVRSLFFRYLLPSISATLVTSIYVLADTIIVGKGIGEDAIAALNLILPLFTIFFGTGLLFGVGGSIRMSLERAKGNYKEGNIYFTTALLANLCIMLIYLFLGIFFFEEIAYLLGSTEETIGYVNSYGRWLVAGIPFFTFSSFLQSFIRNDQAPKLAMVGVITGGILNIILDYIFVYMFHWGMAGASSATVLGSFITCIILLTHFFTKRNGLKLNFYGVSLPKLRQIFTNGLSSFLIELANGILTFFFNIQLLKYIGVLGLTVYSILSNTAIIVTSLSNGIAQAAQPIITMNYGANQFERIKQIKRLGLSVAFIIGSIFALIGFIAPNMVIEIFIHPTKEIMQIAPTAIRLYFFSFIGCTLNMFLSNYFQASTKALLAMVLSLLRGMVLSILLLYLLPALFGATGIWLAMPMVELITFVIALIFLKKDVFHKQHTESSFS